MLLITSCSAPVAPPPTTARPALPVAVPTVRATPPVAAVSNNRGDWRAWPVTAGEWVYRRDGRGSIALFGLPGRDAAMTLRCDSAARRIYLSRQGSGTAAMTVRTSSVARVLRVAPTGGTPAYVAVALAPTDPLLDAMGFSRGRYVMEQAGAPPLVVPARPEILRVAEDCRG